MLEVLEATVGDVWAKTEIQRPEFRKVLEVLEATVGDVLATTEYQRPEF